MGTLTSILGPDPPSGEHHLYEPSTCPIDTQILHVRNVYQAISPLVAIVHLFMVNHPYIRPINQRNGNLSSSQDASQFLDQKMAPRSPRETSGREKGPFHSHSRKESNVCFCWGGKSCLRGVRNLTGGMKYDIIVSCCATVNILFRSGNQRYTH